MAITSNAELRDLIPALTKQEARDLQTDIERRGVIEPLLVAELGDETVIVDGYARHAIATKLGVPFETRSYEYTSTPESVRERLVRDAKIAKSRARSTGEAKALKIMEEVLDADETAKVDAALPEALHAARLRELRLYRLNHAIARRNLEAFDLVYTVWKRNAELYKRTAVEAKRAGSALGAAITRGEVPSVSHETKVEPTRIREQMARDTGLSAPMCERALLIIRTAEGDFIAGYEGLQESAQTYAAQIRDKASDMTVYRAATELRALKKAKDAVDGGAPELLDEHTDDTHIPEDDAIKAFRRMRESVFSHDPLAVAARVKSRTPSEVDRERRHALQEAAWLESYAEALDPSEVPAGEVDLS